MEHVLLAHPLLPVFPFTITNIRFIVCRSVNLWAIRSLFSKPANALFNSQWHRYFYTLLPQFLCVHAYVYSLKTEWISINGRNLIIGLCWMRTVSLRFPLCWSRYGLENAPRTSTEKNFTIYTKEALFVKIVVLSIREMLPTYLLCGMDKRWSVCVWERKRKEGKIAIRNAILPAFEKNAPSSFWFLFWVIP